MSSRIRRRRISIAKPLTSDSDAADLTTTPTLYMARIAEEKSGKPVPGSPIKLLGATPSDMGETLGKLIKNRYPEADLNSLECMPRTRLLSLLLRSSYLVIHFELPSKSIYYPLRKKAFSRFVEGLRSELEVKRREPAPLLRRRSAKHAHSNL
jgi:hypothetical protein